VVPNQYQQRFHSLLAKFLARHIVESRNKDVLSLFAQKKDVKYGWGGLFFRFKKGRWRIEVSYEQHTAQISDLERGGHWFEVLVGVAFQMAGADEVRCRVKWAWSEQSLAGIRHSHSQRGVQAGQHPHMTDADVLVRFGPRIIAASCKAGENVKMQRAKREIEAVANATMGRFCLPVLVEPKVISNIRQQSIEARQGAVILDLQDLIDPHILREVIESAFKARATLSRQDA
jgi:hypothetical protein